MDSQIVIVGTGPGPLSYLTREAEEVLLAADKVFFRISALPVFRWLADEGKHLVSFDLAYRIPRFGYRQVYELITEAIVKEATIRGRAVYALPGNPFVLEATTALIARRARARGMALRVVVGMSFLELVYAELGLDPVAGLQILTPEALRPARAAYSERLGMVIGMIGAPPEPGAGERNVRRVRRWLLERFPPDHRVALVWTGEMPGYETHSKSFALADLVGECGDCEFFASLYVPPLPRGPE